MRKSIRFSVMILLAGIAIVYLIYSGVKETMVYYLTPTELIARAEAYHNTDLRISGKIAAGSLMQSEGLVYRFDLVEPESVEEGVKIPITYQGTVPDAFKEGAEVVVEGTYQTDGTFEASKILTKCPSKYEPDLEQKVPKS